MATIVNERYALSLYEAARDEGKTAEILDQFTVVVNAARETPEFLKILQAPAISLADKKDMLRKTFQDKLDIYLLNFLFLITEKRRVGGLLEMHEAYKQQYYAEHEICEVTATTAVSLDKNLTEKLKTKLVAITGKQVILLTKVDSSILGGIIIKLGNDQIDTSVKSRLEELTHRMTQIIA